MDPIQFPLKSTRVFLLISVRVGSSLVKIVNFDYYSGLHNIKFVFGKYSLFVNICAKNLTHECSKCNNITNINQIKIHFVTGMIFTKQLY